MHLTLKEILDTEVALKRTCALFESRKGEIEQLRGAIEGTRLAIFGCGSSYMLAKSAAWIFGVKHGCNAQAIAGGDYLVEPESYRAAIENAVVIFISRSGKTSELVRAAELCRKQRCGRVIVLTLRENTELGAAADSCFSMPWAHDDSVCQTRSVTTLYTSCALLCAYCFCDNALLAGISRVTDSLGVYMEKWRPALRTTAERGFSSVVVLSDGAISGLAEEAALAFNEICMAPGAYFHVLDYRHGPIALSGPDTLTIVAISPVDNRYQLDAIGDVKACGGTVIGVSDVEVKDSALDLNIFFGERLDYQAFGIPFIFVAQMLAYEKAVLQGNDPDHPRGLHPYVELK